MLKTQGKRESSLNSSRSKKAPVAMGANAKIDTNSDSEIGTENQTISSPPNVETAPEDVREDGEFAVGGDLTPNEFNEDKDPKITYPQRLFREELERRWQDLAPQLHHWPYDERDIGTLITSVGRVLAAAREMEDAVALLFHISGPEQPASAFAERMSWRIYRTEQLDYLISEWRYFILNTFREQPEAGKELSLLLCTAYREAYYTYSSLDDPDWVLD